MVKVAPNFDSGLSFVSDLFIPKSVVIKGVVASILQGHEEFCRADGGVVMTARNIVDKWRETYVTLLLLGPVGIAQA